MVARVIDHPFGAGVIPTPYNPDPALLAIVEIIRAGLVRDQHVRLHQFGTFRLRWSKERRVKHPKTGQSIIVPPAPRITFTPAKQLREWIEPDRKPVIPLDEPLSEPLKKPQLESVKPAPEPEQTIIVDLSDQSADISKTSHNNAKDQQPSQPNLQETVQDIIDEQYSPPDNLSGFTSSQTGSQTSVQAGTQAETKTEEPHKPNKKWALGLLAAVPLIVLLLQADFTNDVSSTNNALSPPPATNLETKSTADLTTESAIINNQIVRTDSIAPDKPLSSVDNTIIDNNVQIEGITPLNSHSSAPEKQTASDLITARSEPIPKPFYMSPQVHAIQHGENLWNLAEKFYGDALLWPHIYRANTRTLTDPDKIITGKKLIIPGLQESPEFLTSKDRGLIAEGYFLVYEFNKTKDSDQAIHFLIGAKEYSFEWLQQNKSRINEKDWKRISR